MRFKQTAVRSISKLLALSNKHPNVRFVFKVPQLDPSSWTKLGFSSALGGGEFIVPAAVGSVTAFNAHGKDLIRKDLPKVLKSFDSFRSWVDWHGYPHSGIQHREMEVYQRDHVTGPAEALYVLSIGAEQYLSTREIRLDVEAEESAVHLANVMLECFGEFDVVAADTCSKIGTRLKRLQWEVLPPGEYPWSKAKPIISEYTSHLDESAKELIGYRMATIAGHKPDFLATGRGGFNAYFVYGFEEKKVFVLESAHLDNATYVFQDDWERLSQLTKREILNGDLPHTRIVHDRHWRRNVNKVMEARK